MKSNKLIALIVFLGTAMEIMDIALESPILEVNSTSVGSTKKKCTKCKCYLVDCTILKKPDIDCEERFAETCENPVFIVDEDDCEQKCHCCIEGDCLLWDNYYCLIYRAYHFLSIVYFMFLIIELFALIGLFDQFFAINRQWSAFDTTVDWENDPKVLTLRYDYGVILTYKHDYDKKVSYHRGFTKARTLMEEFSKETNIAWRNWYVFSVICFLFIIITVLTIYIIIKLPPSKTTFSLIFWVINACGLMLTILTMIGLLMMKTYGEIIFIQIEKFEKENHCKVQIVEQFKIIQFRFKKDKTTFAIHTELSVSSIHDIRINTQGVITSGESVNQKAFGSDQFLASERSFVVRDD